MKAVIDTQGLLALERHGKMADMFCPVSSRGGYDMLCHCGDWCALFGEPVQSMGMVGEEWVPINEFSLALCNNRHIHGEIIDQRETA